MRIHAFAAFLAIIIVAAFYELSAIAVDDWPATITQMVSASDATTILAVVAVIATCVGLVAHFVFERIQRIRGK